MINSWLEVLSDIVQNSSALAPLLVFLAGLLTSLTPCSLSSIPLVMGYIGVITNTDKEDKRKSLRVSLLFALGQIITFTAIGVLTAVLNRLMTGANQYWYIFLGVLLTLMALQSMEIIYIVKPLNLQSNKKGYIGAFITGLIGGIFASPCATPVLIALFGIISRSENMLWGIFLMLLYGIGTNVLVVVSGVFTGMIKKIVNNKNYGKFSIILKYVLGIAILLIAFYMFWLGF